MELVRRWTVTWRDIQSRTTTVFLLVSVLSCEGVVMCVHLVAMVAVVCLDVWRCSELEVGRRRRVGDESCRGVSVALHRCKQVSPCLRHPIFLAPVSRAKLRIPAPSPPPSLRDTIMADPLDLLNDLDDSLATLTTTLAPLLTTPLSDLATTLTVADKARLHVLATYALDSLLFSYLRLQGTDTKGHAIMTELTRVHQYFAKIKGAEPAPERPMALNTSAAERFIKAGLAGNDKYDADRAEQIRVQKVGAMEKLRVLDEKAQEMGSEKGEGVDDGCKKTKVKRSKAEKEARREERKGER